MAEASSFLEELPFEILERQTGGTRTPCYQSTLVLTRRPTYSILVPDWFRPQVMSFILPASRSPSRPPVNVLDGSYDRPHVRCEL